MKCRILPGKGDQQEEPVTVVEVKLHRHTIEVEGLSESNAFELEEILTAATKIKVRRYDNVKDKSNVQGN